MLRIVCLFVVAIGALAQSCKFQENFLESTGEPASRATLMMVLHDLEELRLKACYHSYCDLATVSELQLETAKDEQTSSDSYTAASIEMCQCPAPYAGLSCQVNES